MISSWPKVKEKLHISFFKQVQFNVLSDYAECFKLITFVVFPFQEIKICKSALSEKIDMIKSLVMAVIHLILFKTCPNHMIKHPQTANSSPRLRRSWSEVIRTVTRVAAVDQFLEVQDADYYKCKCMRGLCSKINALGF